MFGFHFHRYRNFKYVKTISYNKGTWYGKKRGTKRVLVGNCTTCGIEKVVSREEKF